MWFIVEALSHMVSDQPLEALETEVIQVGS